MYSSSIISLTVQAIGLLAVVRENILLLYVYVLSMIIGSSIMLLLVLGAGLGDHYDWILGSIWCMTVTCLGYNILQHLIYQQHCQQLSRLMIKSPTSKLDDEDDEEEDDDDNDKTRMIKNIKDYDHHYVKINIY